MCAMYHWTALLLFLLKGDALGLRDVKLIIEPQTVQRMQHATFRCLYDLEEAKLYYVKWYRGSHEFFRCTPSENPPFKIFAFHHGINVDMSRSNSTQVVLTAIDFQLSGQFTCEVTTADEPVSTGTDTQSMMVVQLPEHPPAISVGREPLDYGDVLRANCTSFPSSPIASLTFLLNNLTVARSEPVPPRKTFDLYWSDLPLEMVLTEFHFNRGRLVLQCVARVADIYHEAVDLELNSARQPVPERVSAVDSASYTSAFLQMVLFCSCTLLLLIKS